MPNPTDNDAIIASIAAQKLGPAAAQAAPANPAAGQQGATPAAETPPAPKADPSPTSMEKAAAKVAPNDPGAENPASTDVQFIKIGDKEYTDSQLKGTLERYKDLNFKWQTSKPVLDVVSQIMEKAKAAGHDVKPEDMAGLVEAAVKAFVKNPTFGSDGKKGNEKGDPKQPMSGGMGNGDAGGEDGDGLDGDEAYSQWEKENAVSLPPGFRENSKAVKEISAQMGQMMQMFQKIIDGGLAGQNAQQQAAATVEQGQAMQSDAATKMISNNLNVSFQQAGLPTDPQTRGDFRMFAAQRGYDFPDFLDPELTATIVADYKANKDAPEISRLREIASKRQAFTGMVEGAPGASGTAPAAQAGDPMLNSMVNSAMGKRFG